MSWAAAGLQVFGTALQYSAQRGAARAEREAAAGRKRIGNIEAAHMEQQAVLSVASAQRDMLEQRRQARLLESRALAVAAASGAGASDTTVVNIINDIAAEGAYRSSLALFEGQERARQLRAGAEVRREGGDLQAEYGAQTAKAYEIGSVASLFSGAGSLYARYGQRGSATTRSNNLSGGVSVDE